MKNILRKQLNFHTILHFIFDLFFGNSSEIQVRSTIIFDAPLNQERQTLLSAAAAFELKKCGGLR